MTYEQVMTELFEFSAPTYYKWNKHQKRKIFLLIEKYFTKEDLEEFLNTKNVSKYDAIENSFFSNYVRTSEIIKLLEKSNIEFLCNSLAKYIEIYNGISGITKSLRSNRSSKLEFLRDLEKILLDLKWEIAKSENNIFQSIIKDFNQDIGFDFNYTDTNIIRNIIQRYNVYNTLYDLDKVPKD